LIAYSPASTPPVLRFSVSLLTRAFVKSLKPTPVDGVYGNGTVDVS
jgi:hypothetical protein